MLSIIVTAYKEEKTIGQVVRCLLDSSYSDLGRTAIDNTWEFILIAPDKPTQQAAAAELNALRISASNYKILTDQQQGKPAALNQAMAAAKGDWLLLTDGDVFFDRNAVGEIVAVADDYPEDAEHHLGGVSARPVGLLEKTTMLNYWGALLADAAHHKRTLDLTSGPVGFSTRIVPKRKFFPLSGYGMLVRNLHIEIPTDCLVDDAFLSYELYNKGYKLGYAPKSKVNVKYPTKLSDYFKQKKRSTGGFIQLWRYGVVKTETKSRSFWRELEYFWFPIRYARNIRQLFWSLMLYPARLWLWLVIYWERKIIKKDFVKTWVRIESTK